LSVSAAGDFNGDGYADFIIGAPWVNDPNTGLIGTGSSYVVYGKASGFGPEVPLSTLVGTNGFSISGKTF